LTGKFGSYQFDFVCKIELETDALGQIKTFMPQAKYKHKNGSSLHAYGAGPFCGFQISKNLTKGGVFLLTVDDIPHYVGRCENLSRLFNSQIGKISPAACYENGEPTNCRINNLIYKATQENLHIKLWLLPTTNKRHEIKSELIHLLGTKDRWNRTN
jgi:hypothetical protein